MKRVNVESKSSFRKLLFITIFVWLSVFVSFIFSLFRIQYYNKILNLFLWNCFQLSSSLTVLVFFRLQFLEYGMVHWCMAYTIYMLDIVVYLHTFILLPSQGTDILGKRILVQFKQQTQTIVEGFSSFFFRMHNYCGQRIRFCLCVNDDCKSICVGWQSIDSNETFLEY